MNDLININIFFNLIIQNIKFKYRPFDLNLDQTMIKVPNAYEYQEFDRRGAGLLLSVFPAHLKSV